MPDGKDGVKVSLKVIPLEARAGFVAVLIEL
jgi:hypothetical protein